MGGQQAWPRGSIVSEQASRSEKPESGSCIKFTSLFLLNTISLKRPHMQNMSNDFEEGKCILNIILNLESSLKSGPLANCTLNAAYSTDV